MTKPFSALTILPPDPLLGLMTAYREDSRAEKFDLGVGVYKNETGHTPILRAVKKAEAKFLQAQDSKVYEGPRGNAEFCEAIERFVFGQNSLLIAAQRTVSFTAPGGCGALFLGASLMKRMGTQRVWVSDPTWPNHPKLVKALGLQTSSYRYAKNGAFDEAAMLEDLAKAQPGDGVIIQGPCHNPTGIDVPVEAWKRLGALCKDRGLVAMLDVAYHGFAKGLEQDMAGVRAFIDTAGDLLISYSCSKNFGLYRERTGCLLATATNDRAVEATRTHLADIARASYSMPPAHGAGIVATILNDAALRAEWEEELNEMRGRMISLRTALSNALVANTGSNALAQLAHQNGMFSQLPLSAAQAEALRVESGVYLPGSGRINIAGLKAGDIPALAEILAVPLGR